MTPTVPELLTGNLAAFSEPPPPESAGDFMAGRIGVVGLISLLAAQEAERGVQARVEENGAIRALFRRLAPDWDGRMGGRLALLGSGSDPSLTLSALDQENAELRRELIDLHSLVDAENCPEADALRREIVQLYKTMADGRALHLPPMHPR